MSRKGAWENSAFDSKETSVEIANVSEHKISDPVNWRLQVSKRIFFFTSARVVVEGVKPNTTEGRDAPVYRHAHTSGLVNRNIVPAKSKHGFSVTSLPSLPSESCKS